MLRGGRRDGGRGGEVGAFEVGRGEVCDAGADGRAELGERFLDLGGIVVGLALVDASDPAWGRTRMTVRIERS